MAATITDFEELSASITISWGAKKNVPGLANPSTNQGSVGISYTFTYGTGAGKATQMIHGTQSIAGGATVNFALDSVAGPPDNVMGDTPATVTKIKVILLELLGASELDSAGNAGTLASDITIGAHATTPWVGGPFGATDTYTIKNTEKWMHVFPGGAAVVATDKLKMVNNDGAVTAKVRWSIIAEA